MKNLYTGYFFLVTPSYYDINKIAALEGLYNHILIHKGLVHFFLKLKRNKITLNDKFLEYFNVVNCINYKTDDSLLIANMS